MDEVLGLLLLGVYITGVTALAAGITWAVVKIFPTQQDGTGPDGREEPSTNDGAPSGRLFRRSRRAST